jgi:hypothetical protein
MAERLAELLPGWQRQAPAPLPYGGAHSWDEVAAVLLAAIQEHARIPRGPMLVPA